MTTQPSSEDASPVTTVEEARTRVAELVGHAIRRQLWFMPLDAGGLQLPFLIPIEGIPLRPQQGVVAEMAVAIDALLSEHAPGGSVIVTLERPGGAALTAADQAWAHALTESFGSPMKVAGMFVAHDDGISVLAAP